MAFNVKRLIEAMQNRDKNSNEEYITAKSLAVNKFINKIQSRDYEDDLEHSMQQWLLDYEDDIQATLYIGIYEDTERKEGPKCTVGMFFYIHAGEGLNMYKNVEIARAVNYFNHIQGVKDVDKDIAELVELFEHELNALGHKLSLKFNKKSETYGNGFLYMSSTEENIYEITYNVEILLED